MKKTILFLLSLFCTTLQMFAQQTGVLAGTVRDGLTNETLIQATVMAGDKGTATDFDGNYRLELPAGTHTVKITYVGYQEVSTEVTITAGSTQNLNFSLKEDSKVLKEVEIVADVARSRQTPVAFSNVPLVKIKEEIGTQDLPMVLNSTPGVYATQSGGGAGDARITIRGFNQRFVAIMIDGVPVNDMENGWVYWSNWSGLSDVARNIQVQRGLGASKLALPSIGGTINLLTKGIEAKRTFSAEQAIGANGYAKTTISGSTGRLKGNWGITFTGSYTRTNGYVDQTWSKAWFYFAKIEKELGKHLIGISAVGAPQEHGQRVFKQHIPRYDLDYALQLGVDTSQTLQPTAYRVKPPFDLGIAYNPNWGNLDRWTLDSNGDTIHNEVKVNEGLNYYHKPQFTLKDFWTISSKVSLSTILYASIGNGGGVGRSGSALSQTDAEGQIDLQNIYNVNQLVPVDENGYRKTTNILRNSVNSHRWYGVLSTFDWTPSNRWTVNGGIDLRTYKGLHYREVRDLLGGQAFYDTPGSNGEVNYNENYDKTPKFEGDKIDRNYDGLVKWGGLFTQAEYTTDKFTTFFNLTGAITDYKRIDYYQPRQVVLADTTFKVDYNDTVTYNGIKYFSTSPEARDNTTDNVTIPGFTAKTGVNYNINRHHNIFANVGYLLKAPPFDNVFSRKNEKYPDVVREQILAGEVGYGFRSSAFSANLNGYYTAWLNRPFITQIDTTDDGEDDGFTTNVPGMRAYHRGVELDCAWEIIPRKLKWEGLVSFGDWIWDSDSATIAKAANGELPLNFSARKVHVGDAAQIQLGSTLRWEIIRNLYISGKITFFDKNYSDFQPEILIGPNRDHDSWKLPSYYLVDANVGYKFKVKKMNIKWSASLLNLLDNHYISDATYKNGVSGGNANDLNVNNIEVFFGQGFRWSTALEISF